MSRITYKRSFVCTLCGADKPGSEYKAYVYKRKGRRMTTRSARCAACNERAPVRRIDGTVHDLTCADQTFSINLKRAICLLAREMLGYEMPRTFRIATFQASVGHIELALRVRVSRDASEVLSDAPLDLEPSPFLLQTVETQRDP